MNGPSGMKIQRFSTWSSLDCYVDLFLNLSTIEMIQAIGINMDEIVMNKAKNMIIKMQYWNFITISLILIRAGLLYLMNRAGKTTGTWIMLIGGIWAKNDPYEASHYNSSLVLTILERYSPALLVSNMLYVLARIAMIKLSSVKLNTITTITRRSFPTTCIVGSFTESNQVKS